MDLRELQYKEKRNKKQTHWLRNTLVVFGAIVLTSFVVTAADDLGNQSGSVLGNAINSILQNKEAGPCGSDMVYVSSPGGGFCMDTYEVSTSSDCPYSNPSSFQQTQANLDDPNCQAVAQKNAQPWTFVSHTQAMRACSKAGKHLPSNQEWFLGSLGTPDRENGWNTLDCNVSKNWNSQNKGFTGSGSLCISDAGAYDMIGNVWEWTLETVAQGTYKGIALPDEGYVASVNEEGIPMATEENPSPLFNKDRFWIDKNIHTGIIRGGFWGSDSDAGRFALLSEIPPTFTGAAVGFRCAK